MKIKINTQYLGQEPRVFDLIRDNEVVYVKSYTGSGKTSFIADYLKQSTGNTLFISVNITNCHQIVYSTRKAGVKGVGSYLPVTKADREDEDYSRNFFRSMRDRRVNVVNCLSLHRVPTYLDIDTVIVDEVSSLLPNVFNPIPTSNHKSLERAWQRLVFYLKTCKLILLDGSISDSLRSAIDRVSDRPSVLIENTYKPLKTVDLYKEKLYLPSKWWDGTTIGSDFQLAFQKKLDHSVTTDTKLLISSTQKKKLAEMYAYLIGKETEAEKKGTVFAAAGFVEPGVNLTNAVNKATRILYSPTITTAVDIKGFEGKIVYHDIDFPQISSTTNYQMINRARNARKVICTLSTNDVTIDEPPSKEHFTSILLRYYKHLKFSRLKRIRWGYRPKLKGETMYGFGKPEAIRYGKDKVLKYDYRLWFDEERLDVEHQYMLLFIKTYGLMNDCVKFRTAVNTDTLPWSDILDLMYYVYSDRQSDYHKGIITNFIRKLEDENYTIKWVDQA